MLSLLRIRCVAEFRAGDSRYCTVWMDLERKLAMNKTKTNKDRTFTIMHQRRIAHWNDTFSCQTQSVRSLTWSRPKSLAASALDSPAKWSRVTENFHLSKETSSGCRWHRRRSYMNLLDKASFFSPALLILDTMFVILFLRTTASWL